jgi:hypothetical protein
MTPFSVAASAVALLGTRKSCARKLQSMIRDFRDAPVELTAQSNKVNDLNAVLSEIETATLHNAVKEFGQQASESPRIFLFPVKSVSKGNWYIRNHKSKLHSVKHGFNFHRSRNLFQALHH